MIEIVELDAAATHPLRRSVLRDGTASDVVVFDGDDESTTFHHGAIVDGELVAVATWLWRPYADQAERPAFQLRGMATAPPQRRSGVGGRLLEEGLDRCRSAGAEVVWARARVGALSFYLGRGFRTVGDEYVDSTTGLPHRDVVRDLDR